MIEITNHVLHRDKWIVNGNQFNIISLQSYSGHQSTDSSKTCMLIQIKSHRKMLNCYKSEKHIRSRTVDPDLDLAWNTTIMKQNN